MDVDRGTLLCAIDFSELSHLTIRCGTDLACQMGFSLVVFHSIPHPQDQFQGAAAFHDTRADGHAALQAIERIEQLMGTEAPDYRPVVAFGDPVEAVQQAAETENAFLVISAVRSLSGVKRLLFGTVVERMAHSLSQPLLTVRPASASTAAPPPGTFQLKQIVVGCDLLSGSHPVIDHARQLAGRCHAAIHLLHTIEAPVDDDSPNAPGGTYGQSQQAQHDRLRRWLAAMIPGANWGSNRFTIVLEHGIPGEALAGYASRIKADLIVVGVQPRRGFGQMLVGSTTEFLLRHGPCPVVTVPADLSAGMRG